MSAKQPQPRTRGPKPQPPPPPPKGQAPVPGGLFGMAGVEPSGTLYREHEPTASSRLSLTGETLMFAITVAGFTCFVFGFLAGRNW